MPRIQPNTITKTPWSFTQGGSARRLPLIRLATESQARSVQPLIDRERGVRQANVAGAEAKTRGFDNAMQTVAGAARLAGDMADRAIRMRNETFIAKKAAEYQSAVTLWETGIDEQGRHVGSLFETPYDPGDENGEGMSGATVEIAKAHAKWFEDQQMTPEQAEMVAKHIEPLRGRLFAAARRVDGQKHERDRVEAFASLSRAQADNYYKTGDAAALSEAALTFALSQTPRSQIANFEEWQEGGSRDPAQIQFATPAGKTAFDEAYAKANDGIQEKHVNNLLDEAVNTENEEVAQKLFAMFDASVDNESDAAAFFIKEESQAELRKKLRVAKERRKAVVAGRERDRYQMARDLTVRVLIDEASEEDVQALGEVRAKMKPEALLEIDQFADSTAEKLDYGKWEAFRRKTVEDESAGDKKAVLEELREYAQAMKHPAARERALYEVSRLESGYFGALSGGSGRLSEKTVKNMFRFSGMSPADKLEQLHALADANAISPDSFVSLFDDIKKTARDNVDAIGVLDAMETAGFKLDGFFKRDNAGFVAFGADGRPKLSQWGEAGKKRKVSGWVAESGEGWFNMVDHYKVGEDFMLAVYELAREYKSQELAGVRGLGTLPEFLKARIYDTAAGKEFTDLQLKMHLKEVRKSIVEDEASAVGGYYNKLMNSVLDDEADEEEEGALEDDEQF